MVPSAKSEHFITKRAQFLDHLFERLHEEESIHHKQGVFAASGTFWQETQIVHVGAREFINCFQIKLPFQVRCKQQ